MWNSKVTEVTHTAGLFRQLRLVPGHQKSVRTVVTELGPRYKLQPKVGWWRRRGSHQVYPTTNPSYLRQIGVDLNLQQRLDDIFSAEQNADAAKRVDIGFPAEEYATPINSRKERMEWRKKQRSNKTLEKAARTNTLTVDTNEVKAEHEKSGGLFKEIAHAAEIYGIFEDLFDFAYFTPVVKLSVKYDYDEETVTPVHRGNIIKPKEATTVPEVTFDSEPDALWTLVMTNPDGHFKDDNSEYLHWMVANIKGNDLSTGKTIAKYMQPFPPFGTGYHRFVFILYKQTAEIDVGKCQQDDFDLEKRTFHNRAFFDEHSKVMKPAGLAFFQSDWDSSLTKFYHNVLNMKEPRFEYAFPPPYTKPWTEATPRHSTPFNLFLDTKREPKEIQEEVLKKKLKLTHPFKGQLDGHLKYPNAHRPHINYWKDEEDLMSWRLREVERERLRKGLYKDMDWTSLRRDPSNA